MSNLICGHTWEDIQAMQQGKYVGQIATGGKPAATQSDIDMLRDKGINYIEDNRLYGVIDRLQTSGILPKGVTSHETHNRDGNYTGSCSPDAACTDDTHNPGTRYD